MLGSVRVRLAESNTEEADPESKTAERTENKRNLASSYD